MAGQTNPELQRLLATLNGYAPTPQSTSATIEQTAHSSHNVSLPASIPGLGLLPPKEASTALTGSPKPPGHSSQDNARARRSNPLSSASRIDSPVPVIPDASTITTWPAALKHITKHLANDDKVSTRIQHLISEQHKHERQWWEGREALMSMQESRTGTSAQVSALLRSLGGKDTISAPNDPKANQAELDAYDAKVYRSLVNMTTDFDRQLRAMGVPFFAIKHELVILEEGKEKLNAAQGRLDRGELRELQKRMLQHLEDLFGD